jgi:hypothetical protein
MKFMIQWECHPDKRQDVFTGWAGMDLADYQAMNGPKVHTIGRWHDLINARGVVIVETEDGGALSQALLKWNAVVDFDISVVHDDEEAHALVRGHLAE